MSKIKNDGLDQYGAEAFDRQQFGTAGVEGVKCANWFYGLHKELIFNFFASTRRPIV